VLLVRSAPGSDEASSADATETDGGVVGGSIEEFKSEVDIRGHTIDGRAGTFLAIFAMMAAGEFGDKTQLVTIGLAAEYGATSAIWAGEMLAIIPVSLANAYFFHRFSHRFDLRKAHLFGAVLFAFFGLDTVLAMVTGFSVWETVVEAISNVILALA